MFMEIKRKARQIRLNNNLRFLLVCFVSLISYSAFEEQQKRKDRNEMREDEIRNRVPLCLIFTFRVLVVVVVAIRIV